jgi:ribosomal protein S12 methylthiotransferase
VSRSPRISFVSLGCPKALVDSERIITRLRAEGYELTRDHTDSDLAIVNTCGFLDSAQAESLSAIGAALKENGKVIVTGCMGAEPEKITAAHPNVLAVTGPQQYESVLAAVHQAAPPQHDPYSDLIPPEGIKLTPRHYAYLKISEGCNNRCTFCIIPHCAATWSPGRPPTCCARRNGWLPPASRNSSSSLRTRRPMEST